MLLGVRRRSCCDSDACARATLLKISAAVFVQMYGLGWLLWLLR